MRLKDFDIQTTPDEDSYETPSKLFYRLEDQYGMNFDLDAAAKDYNTKCDYFLNDALHQEWTRDRGYRVDVWCNPPHSMNEEFIRRAEAQYLKHNINIVMIVPANVVGTKAWHELIETESVFIRENHPIKGRPKFQKNGKDTKHPSRNSYVCIVWRKTLQVKGYLESKNDN